MNKSILILLIGLAITLGGCSSVSSKHLIGAPVQEDLSAQFDGAWDFGDDNIGYIKYLGNGQLRIAGAEWERDHFKFSEMTVTLTECGNNRFVNVHDEESVSDKDMDYLFGYCKFVDETYFMVWLPKTELFDQAIAKGSLKGKILQDKNSKTISLTDSSENICLFLKKYKIEELFKLEDPMIYRRIRKIEMKSNSSAETNASGTTACVKPPCP